MLEWLVGTHGDVVPLVLRLTLAVVMFPHGAQNALGWYPFLLAMFPTSG